MAALAALAAVALFLFAQPAAAGTIDHFEVTSGGVGGIEYIGVSEYNSNPSFFAQTATFTDTVVSPSLLGGVRQVNLTWVSGNHGGSGTVLLDPANSYLNYANTPGVDSKLLLTYNGGDATNGFADTDFTDSGASDSILVKYLFSDLGSTVKITVFDGVTSATQSMTAPSGASIEAFLFTGFTPSGGFNASSWNSINQVIVEVDSVNAGDYKIDLLGSGTIPEPVTMCGMLLGITGLVRYTRRRRAA